MTEYSSNSVYVVDGMGAKRQVNPLESICSAFAKRLLKYVLSNGSQSKRTDVVSEVYENNQIKDKERNRRSSDKPSVKKLVRNMRITTWNLLLSSSDNKNKLADFIVQQ